MLRVGQPIFLKDPPPHKPSDLVSSIVQRTIPLCNKSIVSENNMTIATRTMSTRDRHARRWSDERTTRIPKIVADGRGWLGDPNIDAGTGEL